jgi:hypothetical protein
MSIKIYSGAPKLDERKYKEVAAQALQLAQYYFSAGEWDGVDWKSIQEGTLNENDPAYRLMDIFSRLMELLVGRLNQVPVKNFLSFLDMVGVEQKVGNPAEVPVTFLPAKSASTGGQIPAGTQVATTQTDTADAQVFETRSAFYAAPAKLIEAVNVIPRYDTYSRLTLVSLPPEEPGDVENETGRITAFKENDGALMDIDHIVYLESEYLFGGKEPVKLELLVELDNDLQDVFNPNYLVWKRYDEDDEEWQEIDNAYITYAIIDAIQVSITIDPFPGTAQAEINGVEGYWLACLFRGDFAELGEMSVFKEVSGTITAPDVTGSTSFTTKIETAFINSTAVDPSKPVYPFGQRPQYGDAFYIGSREAFAPNVDNVTLSFTILPYSNSDIEGLYGNMSEASSLNSVTVVTDIDWEYLDVNGDWQRLDSFRHTLQVQYSNSSFTITRTAATGHENGTLFGDGSVAGFDLEFSGFTDIGLNKVNKEESYWLRAVVKSFNAYGKDAWMEDSSNDNQPFTVIGPTFMPPIIENVQITYTYKTNFETVNAIQTKNNFEYTVHASGSQPPDAPFVPFIPITSYSVGGNSSFIDPKPALYLGFDKEFGDVYISMFFDIAETLSNTGYALEQGNPHINWEYAASDYTWKPLDVEDGTANLTGSGTVAFTGPVDSLKVTLFKTLLQEVESEAEKLYWYRVRLAEGYFDHAPLIRSVYLNTVMADNRVVSKEDQVVGSGKGTAGQTISLVRTPVTGGELWIREAETPGEEELETLLEDFRTLSDSGSEEAQDMETDDLVEEVEKSDGQTEHWVRWLKVPNFLSSGPRSRHYTLDAVNGKIVFGDGKDGLIPPAGKDNMIISNYRTGGGEAANTAASPLAVKELKSSLPYVDKIFNVQNAVGGSDPWSLEQTMEFGPQSVKSRNRAVTMEDFQWMVLQQFSQVARARCIPTSIPANDGSLSFQPGATTIIIVPNSTRAKPQPSRALLRRIGDYLKEKALGTILENVYVIGPGFEEIGITAMVKPLLPEESSIVERRIISNLEAFFHPLTGGESGAGWEFGRNVYISEVYAVIEGTEGVDYVISAAFTGKSGEDYIEVGDNSLGYSGTHDITMESN